MNIQNLKIYIDNNDNVIKNYKELCSILDIEPTSGKSKTLQLKRFNDYVSFTKQGHKFIIDEILDKPIPPIISNKGNYTTNNAIILCDFLSKCNCGNSVITNFIELSYLLGFINDNYKQYNNNYSFLNDKFGVDTVIDFFKNTRPSWTSHIVSTLNLLKSQFIIDWHQCFNIITSDDVFFNTQDLPPEQRDFTIKQILQAKQDALNLLSKEVSELKNINISFKSIGSIFNIHYRSRYYELFNEQLLNYGFKHVYNAIIIYFSSDRIAINRDSLIKQSMEILHLQNNNQFIKEQKQNKNNRFKKFVSLHPDYDEDWGSMEPEHLRNLEDKYLTPYYDMIDFLINIKFNTDTVNNFIQEQFSDDL